jgi:hemerythrin
MDTMVTGWSDSYLVGIKAIDEDHKGLFELVGALEEHRLNGSHADQVSSTVHALELYVAEHFAREERFMRRVNYPGYEAHRITHEEFRALVRALVALRKQDPDSVDLGKVTRFLERWIRDHIMIRDREYLPYLNGELQSPEGTESASSLTEVTVQVPANKRETVDRFAALMRDGGEIATVLEQALVVHERDHARKLLNKARKLFGVDPVGR